MLNLLHHYLGAEMNRCYLVELLPEQLKRLPPEQLELATQVQGTDEGRWLLFRDSLVAYKVAKLTGSAVRCGQVVWELAPTTPTKGALSCETLALAGGAQVVLEAAVTA